MYGPLAHDDCCGNCGTCHSSGSICPWCSWDDMSSTGSPSTTAPAVVEGDSVVAGLACYHCGSVADRGYCRGCHG